MTYTHSDLIRVRLKYDTNFEKLLVARHGTKEHARYARIDEKLFRREEKIQKALGVHAKDPCVLNTKTYECEDCIGYYKRRKKGNTEINVPCEVKRGSLCPYKRYAPSPLIEEEEQK